MRWSVGWRKPEIKSAPEGRNINKVFFFPSSSVFPFFSVTGSERRRRRENLAQTFFNYNIIWAGPTCNLKNPPTVIFFLFL